MSYYHPYPRSVEQIFKDYQARRNALLRALIQEVDEFYRLCDPEKDNLGLYGHADGRWEVNFPASEVPPEIPQPVFGINFARDGMKRREWLNFVAMHSDSWLLAVAFFVGLHLNSNERERLFSLINALPTIFEILTKWEPIKDEPTTDSGNKSCGTTKRYSDGQVKSKPKFVDNEKDEDKRRVTLCGICGRKYNANEFWIGCDVCERWFHGKCVKITPAKAESIQRYKCPSCSTRREKIYELEKLIQK